MSLLNLTLAEFFALFAPIAAAIVAMYLYDRARRKQIVSTLRFFRSAAPSMIFTRRKKIQQPWSLILQIACVALLLLAIGELHLGRARQNGRDHVLILETSAWMSSAPNGGRGSTLMDLARRRALEYVHALPSEDRLMVMRADALPTPVTSFTRDRREAEAAIRSSGPASTALNLSGALELARSAQRLSSSRPGEIVFVGSGRAQEADLQQAAALSAPKDTSNLRTVLVGEEAQDCGIRKLSARRLPADPLNWEIVIELYNYGAAPKQGVLRVSFAGSPLRARRVALDPHEAVEESLELRSSKPGLLEALLDLPDDFRADNRASVELTPLDVQRVQVFTQRPALWQPLLTSSIFLKPEFHTPEEYTAKGEAGRLVILDGFTPFAPPDADSVWIVPSGAGSTRKAHVQRWTASHPIASGLHNKDLRLEKAVVLRPDAGDVVVAEADSGPVLLASSANGRKKVVFGFHPLQGEIASRLAAPLLFANVLQWVNPELFRLAEIRVGPPGLIELETPSGTRRDQVAVSSPQMADLPFTLVGDRLRFFTGRAGTVRVRLPERDYSFWMNLPEIGESRWTPPAGARRGVPRPAVSTPLSGDLWPWLALAAALGLLAEWRLYGRTPAIAPTTGQLKSQPAAEPAPAPAEAEEVRT